MKKMDMVKRRSIFNANVISLTYNSNLRISNPVEVQSFISVTDIEGNKIKYTSILDVSNMPGIPNKITLYLNNYQKDSPLTLHIVNINHAFDNSLIDMTTDDPRSAVMTITLKPMILNRTEYHIPLSTDLKI